LLSLPWWLKNFLATGNPVYPFFLQAGSMDSFRLAFYHITPWGDWRDVLLLPVLASLTGVEGAPGYSASIGPLLVGLGVCALIRGRERTEQESTVLRIGAIIGLTTILVWIIAARLSGYLIQSRLYTTGFSAFAVLAADGYRSLSQVRWRGVRLERLAGTLVLLVFTLNVFEICRYTLVQGAPLVFLGIHTQDKYLEDNLGWYAPAMQAIRDLPQGSRVVMLWEPRSLYCLPKCAPDEIIDRWKRSMLFSGSPGEILQIWRAEGFTHLLFYRLGAEFVRSEDKRYTESDWEALDSLLNSLSKSGKDFGPAYTLYSLEP
jgi:hypothetical protein